VSNRHKLEPIMIRTDDHVAPCAHFFNLFYGFLRLVKMPNMCRVGVVQLTKINKMVAIKANAMRGVGQWLRGL
jgi:hypothetical protein